MDPSDHLDIDTSRYFTVEKEVMCDIMNHVNNTNQNLVCRWFWRLLLLSHNKLQLSLPVYKNDNCTFFLDIYCIHFALGNFSSIFVKKFDYFEAEIKAILIRIVLLSFMAWLMQNLLLTPQVICKSYCQ